MLKRSRLNLFVTTAFLLFFIVFLSNFLFASPITVTAIGKIESLYENRVGMKVLEIVGTQTEDIPLKVDTWITFDLPKDAQKARKKDKITYGNIVEVDLTGSTITEYEADIRQSLGDKVIYWTALTAKKIKNQKDYLEEEPKKSSRKRKKKNKEPEKPEKLWIQQETVRGELTIKNNILFIKEDHLGKRDKGLEVLPGPWLDKLREFENQRVVVHGTTTRETPASGTIEIENLMRLYSR